MGKRPKLLVVDNEVDICNFVKAFFEPRGIDVATALNGDDAMSKLAKEKPDLVILDVMMRTPGEGFDYLPKVKKELPAVPVIMITGIDDEDAIKKAKEMGAEDYITKPLVLESLENTVLSKFKNLKSKSY